MKSNDSQRQNEWFMPKPYLHLTDKIAKQGSDTVEFRAKRDLLIKQIKNPLWVAKHAFYPLIRYDIVERRYKKRTEKNEKGDSVTLQKKGKGGKLRSFRSHKEYKDGIRQSTRKIRGIEFPTHIDSQVYSYYKELLYEKYDALLRADSNLDKSVLAYRYIPQENTIGTGKERGKNVAHFAKEVFDEIKAYVDKNESCIAACFDIEGFFPSLCHKRILEVWKEIIGMPERLRDDHFAVYKSMTKFRYIKVDDLHDLPNYEQRMANFRKQNIHSYMESPKEFRTLLKEQKLKVYKNDKEHEKKGIPHGLALSSTMANMYLLDFDRAIIQKIVIDKGGFYRRYSDDIVILCKEGDEEEVQDIVMAEIENVGLKVQRAKTDIFRFQKKDNDYCVFKLVRERELGKTEIKEYWKPNIPLLYLGFEFYGHRTLLKSATLARFYRRMIDSLRRKARRLKAHNKAHAEDAPAYLNRLRLLYTDKGLKPCQIKKEKTLWIKESTVLDCYVPKKVPVTPKKDKQTGRVLPDFRGNILAYAKRVANVMEDDNILMQFKKHKKIFDAAWERHRQRNGLL